MRWIVALREGCADDATWLRAASACRWLHVADTRGTDSDSRRSVPLSVVTSPSWWCWCWRWWWCYGRLCLAFLPRSTNRDEPPVHARRRVARFLATVRPALPFPFPSRLSFFLSFSLFPFFSFFRLSCPPTTTAVAMASLAHPRQRNTSSCRSSHTFQGVPHVRRRDTSVCFCPATRNQGSRALRLIIRRQSAFRIAGESLIKGYVA